MGMVPVAMRLPLALGLRSSVTLLALGTPMVADPDGPMRSMMTWLTTLWKAVVSVLALTVARALRTKAAAASPV